MARVPLIFTVNGAEQAEFVEPGALLVDVLRDKLGLTATKNGCGQGTCGACTVIVDGEPKLSCLIPAQRVEGARSRRWKGLRDGGELHPLQRAFAEGFAAQCGFCAPGMILAAKGCSTAIPIRAATTSSTRSPATSAAAPATSRSSTPSSPPPPRCAAAKTA